MVRGPSSIDVTPALGPLMTAATAVPHKVPQPTGNLSFSNTVLVSGFDASSVLLQGHFPKPQSLPLTGLTFQNPRFLQTTNAPEPLRHSPSPFHSVECPAHYYAPSEANSLQSGGLNLFSDAPASQLRSSVTSSEMSFLTECYESSHAYTKGHLPVSHVSRIFIRQPLAACYSNQKQSQTQEMLFH
jgi:hypothetical protein